MQCYYRLNSEYETESIFKRDNHYYENLNGKETCIDDEIPFETPNTWRWSRLSTLGTMKNGLSSRGIEGGDFHPVIRLADLKSNTISYDCVRSICISHSDYYAHLCKSKDVLLIRVNGSKNRIADSFVFDYNETMCFCDHIICMSLGEAVDPFCFSIFMRAFAMKTLIVPLISTSAGQNTISQKSLNRLLLPIPPLTEQKRIVAGVKGYESIIDIHNCVVNDTLSLCEKLNSTIFDLAIRGKLLKQNPNERPVEINCKSPIIRRDNSYYEIVNGCEVCIDDSIPFQIPENWTWQRLSNICSYIHRGKSPKYSETKKYPVIAQKCNQWSGVDMSRCLFIDPESITRYDSDCIVKTGDILINSTGTGSLGRIGIYDEGLNIYELAVADSHVTIVRCYRVKSEYVYLYLISPTIQSVIEDWSTGSTNQKELPTKVIQSILVPIPPSDEQLRIQSKVKELKSLLNALE